MNTIIARSRTEESDQEFKVKMADETIVKKRESAIIKEIKSGIGYKTEPSTPVKINKNGDKEYIHSTPNNTTADNLKSLPRY